MDDIAAAIECEIPRMRRYARVLLRNDVDADDLVQDALLRALDKAHLWQRGTDLRAWLLTILHNQYVNGVRKAVRARLHVPIEAAMSMGCPASQLDSVELSDLKIAIDDLPGEQRAVVLFIGLQGMSYDEVTAIMSVPVGTVRSRLSRAREALRERLDAPERTTAAKKAADAHRAATARLAPGPVPPRPRRARHCPAGSVPAQRGVGLHPAQ
jgi:RNA polymerase sigma-70 factor (ECF subfamily)